MAHFDDIKLELTTDRTGVRFGSQMGVSTSVDMIFVGSGFRFANSRWSQKLRKYSIRIGPNELNEIYVIRRIYEAVDGPANSFLFRDWGDWNTREGFTEHGDENGVGILDQPLRNTVTSTFLTDGSTTKFQCLKQYASGSAVHTRTIQKPNTSFKFVVGIDSVEVDASDYTVNTANGEVDFIGSPAPGAEVGGGSPDNFSITWGGSFFVPVTFVSNDFNEILRTYRANDIATIELIEERIA